MPRFSLGGLFAAIVWIAVVLALGQAIGWACLLLAGMFCAGRRMSGRVCVAVVAFALFLASLPWFGVTRYSFVVPVAGTELLPTLDLSRDQRSLLEPWYALGEFLMLLLAAPGGVELHDAIYFSGEGPARVRPFSLFAFWIAMAVMLAIGGLTTWLGRKRSRTTHEPPPSPTAATQPGSA